MEITSYFFIARLSLSQKDGASSALVRFHPGPPRNTKTTLGWFFPLDNYVSGGSIGIWLTSKDLRHKNAMRIVYVVAERIAHFKAILFV